MLKSFKSKNKIILLVLLITISGAFFRFYDFFDLILFEVDQARDYKLINKILDEGFSNFPLIGPKAGGTFFRLGSIYYIPALLFAYIFGVYPYVLVLPEALLSVVAIPLFFVFLREFFNQKISLYLAAIFSVALFFVEYAHFSWNPNYIPFFFILTLYSILKYSQEKSNKILWVSLLAFSCGFLMQLHTITLIAMPLILILYFIFQKKKIILKHLIIFLGIIVIIFSPLILNDFLTKGENLREFKAAFISRSTRDKNPSSGKSIFMNAYNHVRYYSIILTSQNYVKELKRVDSSKNLRELIAKNKGEGNLIKAFLFFIFFASGFLFIFFKAIKFKEGKKYNFLILILIVQVVFCIVFMPLSLRMDSRYFFPVAIMPFVFLGMIFSFFEDNFSRGKFFVALFFLVLLILNAEGSFRWLSLVKNYQYKYEKNKEFILDKYFIVTIKQWNGIIDKVVELSKNHQGNLYVQTTPFHINSLKYLLELERNQPVRVMDTKNLDSTGMYFFLRERDDFKSGELLPESVGRRFDIIDQYDFGTVILIQLKIKNTVNSTSHSKFGISSNPKLPKCYELSYNIEARDICMFKDIGHLFGK